MSISHGRKLCLMMTPVLMLIVLAVAVPAMSDAQAPLTSSHEGSFSMRYHPGGLTVGYSVQAGDESVTLSFDVPERPRWILLDGAQAPKDRLAFDADARQATVIVPAGTHTVEVGWVRAAPAERSAPEIPVHGPQGQVGVIDGYYDRGFMGAAGKLRIAEPVTATLRLEGSGTLAAETVSLTVGGETIDRWWEADGALISRRQAVLDDGVRLSLVVEEPNLQSSPIDRILLERVTTATSAEPLATTALPDDALLIEAEWVEDGPEIGDFTSGDFGASGSSYVIDPGSHTDTHGGSCVFSFRGNGTSLWWSVIVPEDGLYALRARVAQDGDGYRRMTIDGRPAPGLKLVRFPSTGGWGHAADDWQIVEIAGPNADAPPLRLSAGKHRIEMTGVLQNSINIDYLLVVPLGES